MSVGTNGGFWCTEAGVLFAWFPARGGLGLCGVGAWEARRRFWDVELSSPWGWESGHVAGPTRRWLYTGGNRRSGTTCFALARRRRSPARRLMLDHRPTEADVLLVYFISFFEEWCAPLRNRETRSVQLEIWYSSRWEWFCTGKGSAITWVDLTTAATHPVREIHPYPRASGGPFYVGRKADLVGPLLRTPTKMFFFWS
jgi:hypothetical protein